MNQGLDTECVQEFFVLIENTCFLMRRDSKIEELAVRQILNKDDKLPRNHKVRRYEDSEGFRQHLRKILDTRLKTTHHVRQYW